ncbi:MAG TPA: YheC/YheD family protein [Bacillota bacterium]|nr:YheC/YheD family protein [Bacillota bacterium]
MPSIFSGIGSANPIIGVFVGNTKQIVRSGRSLPHYGPVASLCRALNATAYIFSPQDIDYRKHQINGIAFDRKRGQWIRKKYPFPHILYLQGGLEKLDPKELARFQLAVKSSKIRPVSSPLEFNKWEVYRILYSRSSLRPYLPETKLFRSAAADLEPMLKRYGAVYLKACRGRRGEQVMRLALLPDKAYHCCYFNEKPVASRLKNFSQAVETIQAFFRRRGFVVQQPIDLIEYKGKKVDLRAEMQRNGEGALEILGIPVRVALENSPITTHALSYRFEKFFLEMMGYNEAALQDLRSRLNSLLYRIYQSLESRYGPLGEMGIDIGLDKKGNLWVIECNALSAMVSLGNAYEEKTVLRAFGNALDYALYKHRQNTAEKYKN